MKLKNTPRWLWLYVKQLYLMCLLLKDEYDLIRLEHESEVLDALQRLTERDMANSTDIGVRVLLFFKEHKKPRSARYNLPYLWPKRDLIRLLNQNGVAVGPVPNYFVALHQLVDKGFK